MVTASPTSPTSISPNTIPPVISTASPTLDSQIHPLKAALVPPTPVTTTTMVNKDAEAVISTIPLELQPNISPPTPNTSITSPIPYLDGLEEVSILDDVPLPYTILYHALVFKDEMPLSILMERHQTGLSQIRAWIDRATTLVGSIEQTRLQDVQQLEPEVLDVISGLHRHEATVESSLEILSHLEETIQPRRLEMKNQSHGSDMNPQGKRRRKRRGARMDLSGLSSSFSSSSSSEDSLSEFMALTGTPQNQEMKKDAEGQVEAQGASVQEIRKQWQQLLASMTGLGKTVREHQRLRLGLQSVDNLSGQVHEASQLLDRCLQVIETDRIEQQQQQQTPGAASSKTIPTIAELKMQAASVMANSHLGSRHYLASTFSSSTLALQATTNNDMLELESRMGLLSIQIASLKKSFPECKSSRMARRRSSATSHSSQTNQAASQHQQRRRRRNSRQDSTKSQATTPKTEENAHQPLENAAVIPTPRPQPSSNQQQNDSQAIKEQKERLVERYCELMASWQELRGRKKKLWRDLEHLDRWRAALTEKTETLVQMLEPIREIHQKCFKYLESLDQNKTLHDEQLLPLTPQEEEELARSRGQPSTSSSSPNKQRQTLPVHLRLYQSKSAHEDLGSRSSSSSRHQRQTSSYSGQSSQSMPRSATAPAAPGGGLPTLRFIAGVDPKPQRVLNTLASLLKDLEERQNNAAPNIENMFWVLESDLQLPSAAAAVTTTMSPSTQLVPPSLPSSPQQMDVASDTQTSPTRQQQQQQQPTSPMLATPVTKTMPTSPVSPGQVAPPTPRACCFNSVPVPFYPTATMVERHRSLKEQWSELKTSLDQMGPRLSAHFSTIEAQIQDAIQAAEAAAARREQEENDNKTLVGTGSVVDGHGRGEWRRSTSSPVLRRGNSVGRQIIVSPGWNPSSRAATPKWSAAPSLNPSLGGSVISGIDSQTGGPKFRRRYMLVTSESPLGSKGRPWCPSVSVTSPGLPGFPQTISTWGYFLIGPNGEIYPDEPRYLSPSPTPHSPPSRAHTSPNLKDTRPPFSPGGNRPYTALSQNRPMSGPRGMVRAKSAQSNPAGRTMKGGGGGGGGIGQGPNGGAGSVGASVPNLTSSGATMPDQPPLNLQQRRRGSKQTMPPGQLWIPANGLSSQSSVGSMTDSSLAFMTDDDDAEYDDDDDDDDGNYYSYGRALSSRSSMARGGHSSRASSRYYDQQCRVWSPSSPTPGLSTSSHGAPWSTHPMVAAARSSAALHTTLLARGTATSISPVSGGGEGGRGGLDRAMSVSPPMPTMAAFQQGSGRKIWLQNHSQQGSNTILAALSFTVPKFSM
ncbi:hypothetical protein BGW42_007174 [Actinomortierella wolfii]|nr:hypothetical protein BGW42_007174 [Actinomortierella wolfii]